MTPIFLAIIICFLAAAMVVLAAMLSSRLSEEEGIEEDWPD